MENKINIKFDMNELKGKCPVCENSIGPDKKTKKIDRENYEKYISQSNECFGYLSLPLCFRCWIGCAKKCYCGNVIGMDNDNEFINNNLGMNILYRTTFHSEECDDVCSRCATKGDSEED